LPPVCIGRQHVATPLSHPPAIANRASCSIYSLSNVHFETHRYAGRRFSGSPAPSYAPPTHVDVQQASRASATMKATADIPCLSIALSRRLLEGKDSNLERFFAWPSSACSAKMNPLPRHRQSCGIGAGVEMNDDLQFKEVLGIVLQRGCRLLYHFCILSFSWPD
jgi:hypothetical protein